MSDTNSEFLKGARAMDDFALQQRIRAAVLFHGATLLTGAVAPARNYAVASFINPTQIDPTMLALVCTKPVVAASVVVPAEGTSVDTSAVLDSVILQAVKDSWALVAAKYTKDPLSAPSA